MDKDTNPLSIKQSKDGAESKNNKHADTTPWHIGIAQTSRFPYPVLGKVTVAVFYKYTAIILRLIIYIHPLTPPFTPDNEFGSFQTVRSRPPMEQCPGTCHKSRE